VIAVGSPATPCNCTTRRLVTFDGGRSWRRAPALGPDFQGRGRFLYWWREEELHRVFDWPAATSPLRSRVVASVDGSIVDAASTPEGVAALVDRRGRVPQVAIARGDEVTVSTLPDAGRETVARSVDVSWPTIVVRGIDTSDVERSPFAPAEWRSRDGGATWLFSRS
jgi:hypothetical protein